MADTGTKDATYDLISVAFHALQGVENCTTYEQDAESDDLRSFFREAQQRQRELADRAKSLLSERLSQ
jgi:uncharacterized protein (UPF0276 family)